MSNSVRPHRWQPTKLPRPWDSPGKNTGVGCHFLLQCMKVKSESEVTQSCPILSHPMDCSLPGSSVHGIFQARVWKLEVQNQGTLSKDFGGRCYPASSEVLAPPANLHGISQMHHSHLHLHLHVTFSACPWAFSPLL